ncbi:hypothetical protein PPERSA_10056 [Pseudocohnilembus persalinus]|uniref:Uncharacterized protein n=1 Tax=Pseudocohnilembus persalinus TaxID=266149 RepID=A0A0V0QJN0_PSEPJ|nr:hypothetical protein PPERSA_10056 [Pseudocohnilembus persalinus]|eukprot:KRX02439.1 hypothetical protein PPERSA_10056 [Pseudocohnilembus persalinus]
MHNLGTLKNIQCPVFGKSYNGEIVEFDITFISSMNITQLKETPRIIEMQNKIDKTQSIDICDNYPQIYQKIGQQQLKKEQFLNKDQYIQADTFKSEHIIKNNIEITAKLLQSQSQDEAKNAQKLLQQNQQVFPNLMQQLKSYKQTQSDTSLQKDNLSQQISNTNTESKISSNKNIEIIKPESSFKNVKVIGNQIPTLNSAQIQRMQIELYNYIDQYKSLKENIPQNTENLLITKEKIKKIQQILDDQETSQQDMKQDQNQIYNSDFSYNQNCNVNPDLHNVQMNNQNKQQQQFQTVKQSESQHYANQNNTQKKLTFIYADKEYEALKLIQVGLVYKVTQVKLLYNSQLFTFSIFSNLTKQFLEKFPQIIWSSDYIPETKTLETQITYETLKYRISKGELLASCFWLQQTQNINHQMVMSQYSEKQTKEEETMQRSTNKELYNRIQQNYQIIKKYKINIEQILNFNPDTEQMQIQLDNPFNFRINDNNQIECSLTNAYEIFEHDLGKLQIYFEDMQAKQQKITKILEEQLALKQKKQINLQNQQPQSQEIQSQPTNKQQSQHYSLTYDNQSYNSSFHQSYQLQKIDSQAFNKQHLSSNLYSSQHQQSQFSNQMQNQQASNKYIQQKPGMIDINNLSPAKSIAISSTNQLDQNENNEILFQNKKQIENQLYYNQQQESKQKELYKIEKQCENQRNQENNIEEASIQQQDLNTYNQKNQEIDIKNLYEKNGKSESKNEFNDFNALNSLIGENESESFNNYNQNEISNLSIQKQKQWNMIQNNANQFQPQQGQQNGFNQINPMQTICNQQVMVSNQNLNDEINKQRKLNNGVSLSTQQLNSNYSDSTTQNQQFQLQQNLTPLQSQQNSHSQQQQQQQQQINCQQSSIINNNLVPKNMQNSLQQQGHFFQQNPNLAQLNNQQQQFGQNQQFSQNHQNVMYNQKM